VEANVPHRAPVSAGSAAASVPAVGCLPTLISKVLRTFGAPVGIANRSVLDDTVVATKVAIGVLAAAAAHWRQENHDQPDICRRWS
jgi:hypothetical protein